MGFVWNPWALPGLIAAIMAFAMAGFVYFAAPGGHAANRRLALVLFFEGAAIGAGTALIYSLDDVANARAAQALSITCVLVLPFLYLYFMGVLDTKYVRPLRIPAVQLALGAILAWILFLWFSQPRLFLAGMYQPELGYAAWDGDWGPVYKNLGLYFRTPIYLFALLASIVAYLHANTAIAKRRARAYVIAFGVRDVFTLGLTFAIFGLPALDRAGLIDIAVAATVIEYLAVIGFPIMMMVFVPVLAYGILSTQLFDIDFKIRWTINKGTLASFFLLAFIVGAQTLEAILGERYGWVGGGLAMGFLLFALTPLQRAAERLASRAMPGAVPVAELPVKERLRLFQEQLEYAWADGALNKKERMLLDHLRSRLGLEKREAAKLEAKITARFAILQGIAPTRGA